MKKIVIALATLGALSTAALAERSQDLRDIDTYRGPYATKMVEASAVSESYGVTAPSGLAGLTAYERQMLNAEKIQHNEK